MWWCSFGARLPRISWLRFNFSGTSYPRFNLGVPYAGSYKEIFTTDEERFGGSGLLNPRALPARAMEVMIRT